MKVRIKYFSKDYPRLEKIEKGDRIDLRVDGIKKYERKFGNGYTEVVNADKLFQIEKELKYKKDDIVTFKLGVAMELPDGFEAVLSPRSSTFKHWGLIQTNSVGVIDNSFSGDNDEWLVQMVAMRDGVINRHDRIVQFRIQEKMQEIELEEVEVLGNKDRGGYGSTGRR